MEFDKLVVTRGDLPPVDDLDDFLRQRFMDSELLQIELTYPKGTLKHLDPEVYFDAAHFETRERGRITYYRFVRD